MTTVYGQAVSEKRAHENEVCRQIVKEITNLNLTQRQLLFVAYLLGLELENVEQMRALTTVARELGGADMVLIGSVEQDTDEIAGTGTTLLGTRH